MKKINKYKKKIKKKVGKVIEFILVKVERENEYLVDEYIQEYEKFVREYDKDVFLIGGKVSIEGDDRLWIIREIAYNEEFDINIIYIIDRNSKLFIHK
jgi:predicted nuclease of restriction endonuclease-like (RecB) superfamily